VILWVGGGSKKKSKKEACEGSRGGKCYYDVHRKENDNHTKDEKGASIGALETREEKRGIKEATCGVFFGRVLSRRNSIWVSFYINSAYGERIPIGGFLLKECPKGLIRNRLRREGQKASNEKVARG